METMTAEMEVMNKIVTCHVLIQTLNVNQVEDVSWIVGDVMEMQIVRTEVMKILQYVVSIQIIGS